MGIIVGRCDDRLTSSIAAARGRQGNLPESPTPVAGCQETETDVTDPERHGQSPPTLSARRGYARCCSLGSGYVRVGGLGYGSDRPFVTRLDTEINFELCCVVLIGPGWAAQYNR